MSDTKKNLLNQEAKQQCDNMIAEPGIRRSFQCARDATGKDGLCNVCRAAKLRGRKRTEEMYAKEENL